jgi:hypothetical protein
MIYADITEVRQETRVAECKKLLENGWVLLGVYPLTTAGDPKQKKSRKGQQERNPKDTPRYVVAGAKLEISAFIAGQKP